MFLHFNICNYICLDTSYNFFGFIFTNQIFFIFFKYSCTSIFHRRSLWTFYSHKQVAKYSGIFLRSMGKIKTYLLSEQFALHFRSTNINTPKLLLYEFSSKAFDKQTVSRHNQSSLYYLRIHIHISTRIHIHMNMIMYVWVVVCNLHAFANDNY